jgi:hypothetical protein
MTSGGKYSAKFPVHTPSGYYYQQSRACLQAYQQRTGCGKGGPAWRTLRARQVLELLVLACADTQSQKITHRCC